METILKKPELYNLLYKDVNEDIKLYQKLLKNFDEIVEYGAGTGRITIPLALTGKKIYAIDNENKMLQDLKIKLKSLDIEKQVEVISADMITFNLYKQVDCLIMPLTVFNYILDEKQQNECLQNIAKNLNKNGTLILELLTRKTFEELENDDGSDERFRYIRRFETKDGYYEYWRKTFLNNETNFIKQLRKFQYYNKNDELQNEETFIWENKFIEYNTIENLLEKNGFKIQSSYGNCKMDRFNNDSEDLFIQAIKL